MGFTLALVMIEGRIGMFVVETIARIRRAHFVQGKSIKAICRELRVSRKTVRKVIRSEATEFQYERDEQPMPRVQAPLKNAKPQSCASNPSTYTSTLRLTRVGADEEHPAVAQAQMRHLHRDRRAIDQYDLVAPVELVGLAGREAQRHERVGRRCRTRAAPASGISPDRIIAARVTQASQCFE